MNNQKLTLRLAVSARAAGLDAVLEGVPRGVTIDEPYVSHQLWRLRRAVEARRPDRRAPLVAIEGGIERANTSGASLALRIASRGLGVRASKPIAPGCEWTFGAVAGELAALTVVRKLLEDRQLFVGSRVLDPARLERLDDESLGRLLTASCGAYKITERADEAPSRVIRFTGARGPRSEELKMPRAFELLISGPPGWVRRAARPQEALLKALARRILSTHLVISVSADTGEGPAGVVEIIRLRGVLSGRGVRRDDRSAVILSVLAETLLVVELAASVMGWRIDGLSDEGPFGLASPG